MMWLVFAAASLICYALSDLLGKKYTDSGGALAPAELLAFSNAGAFAAGLAIFAAGLGESGQPPWQLLWDHPLILASVLCYALYWLFFLFSMRCMGLSVNEAVQSTFGVFYFLGLIIVNLLTGKLSGVREMLHPLRLIPIVLVLVFTVLLPNTEVIAQRRNEKLLPKAKLERRSVVIGLLLLLTATLFDALDSLAATVVLEDDGIGAVDFMQASYFAHIIPLVLFSAVIMLKSKGRFLPFKDGGRSSACYVFAALFSSVFYLLACSYDAVRTGILFIAYPVVPILGAKIFLKEKYTWRQNLCIRVITIASVAFCISDHVI